MTDETGHDREERLNEVMAAYVQAFEAGKAPDRQELLAKNVDIADELKSFFADYDGFNKLAGPFRDALRDVSQEPPETEVDSCEAITEGAEPDDLDATRPLVASSHASKIGDHVPYFGDYRLTGEIARGGMGVVYRAHQISLNRPVALKMILAGTLAGEADLRRFRNEAEAVANLDHPGIVPIYEVGVHEGQSYFSMKLIEGGSLAERLPEYTADPKAAARLLVAVARAVHHAHQRGVLHRDLKPSNILVDSQGQPHVSDFGLAKRVEGDAELTQSGAILGSPPYMAPEQTTGHRGEVTTATDVYGMGAILYAMLAGRPPFRADSVMETIEQVRKREPEPPSGINQRVDLDLQTICLKCLDKDPKRRYGSAAELAEDLDRWLEGRPVLARPVGRVDRAWRWVRRNPVVAGLSSLVLILMLGGLIGLAISNTMISRRNAEVVRQRNEIKRALEESEESRKQAEAVSSFLVEAFRKPDPSQDGATVKVVDVLDQALAKLDAKFAGSPKIRGELLNALGRTYLDLGLWARALKVFTQAHSVRAAALGIDHRETLITRNSLGEAYWAANRANEAIALDEETLRLSIAKLGPDHSTTLRSRQNLAAAYWYSGRTAEAIALQEETLNRSRDKLGRDHPDTLTYSHNLALAYHQVGRKAQAIRLNEETLKVLTAKRGADHPSTLTSRNNLAAAYLDAGRTADAIEMDVETLNLATTKLGPNHPQTIMFRNNLADAYSKAGRMDEAIMLQEVTLKLVSAKIGPDHINTLIYRNNLARCYIAAGRYGKAESLLSEGLTMEERRPDDWMRLITQSRLGEALIGQKRYAEAEPLIVSSHEALIARSAKNPPIPKHVVLDAGERVVRLYEAWGKSDKASEWKNKLGLADLPADVFARP